MVPAHCGHYFSLFPICRMLKAAGWNITDWAWLLSSTVIKSVGRVAVFDVVINYRVIETKAGAIHDPVIKEYALGYSVLICLS